MSGPYRHATALGSPNGSPERSSGRARARAVLLLVLSSPVAIATACDKLVTPEVPATPIEISAPNLTPAGEISLRIDQNVQLVVRGAVGEVLWSSDDPLVARVEFTGWVRALRGGTATITARNLGREASVRVTVIDPPPVADAGEDVTVAVGVTVTLDGNGSSDEDDQSLTFGWEIASRPAGSSAELSGANTATPSLTPDVAGDYVIELIVNDGTQDSQPDQVVVTAIVPMVVCNATPTSLNHGTVPTWTGESSDRQFTIANTGTLTAQGDVSESCPAYAIQVGGGSFILPPGQTRDVTVRFGPDADSPGEQACSIRTGIPECPSVPATGIGSVSFSQQLLTPLQNSCGACHAADYPWIIGTGTQGPRTNTSDPPNSPVLTYPSSGSHGGGSISWPIAQYRALLIAWIIQGRPDN